MTHGTPILVTGATGRHGGTSAHIVGSLLRAGYAVRVLARRRDERTKALSAMGADVVLGDFNDRRSLVAALDEVETATFTYPIAGGIVPAAATFASAAKDRATPLRLVVMSMAVAHPDSPSLLGRAQWLAEEVLAWAGLDLCVLRIAAVFFENLTALHAASIRDRAEFANSFGDAPVPWISGLDAARLMVAAVTRPDLFAGSAIHYPPGAELLSHGDVAAMLATVLARPVRFHAVAREDWAADLTGLARAGDGVINVDMAQHIPAVGEALASSRAPRRAPDPAELERLTGFPPIRMSTFLEDNRSVFSR